MNIGIFIGCFNPVHIAHIACAKELVSSKMLDKVIFVPVGDKYEKAGLVSAKYRLQMLRAVTENFDQFEISDIEVLSGKLYTYETLQILRQKFVGHNIKLIIGTDNLKDFYNWKNKDFILNNFEIIVLTRDHLSAGDFPEYRGRKNIVFVTSNKPVSSTKIRELIAQKNYDKASEFLDPKVLKIIRKNKLFEG